MENNDSSAFDSFELNVSENIKRFLKEISNWSYFLSILGFVGIAFMLVIGLFYSAILGAIDTEGTAAYRFGYSAGIGVFYVIVSVIYLFPIYYLFKFSRKMKKALHFKSNDDFEAAFSNLKSHYKYIGIAAIVVISLYVLLFLLVAVGASSF